VLKKLLTPEAMRKAAMHLICRFKQSQRRVCSLISLNRSTFGYKVKPNNDGIIRNRLKELATQRRRFGCPRLHILLRREGVAINHKRTERIYREEGLSLRRRKRKKTAAIIRTDMPKADKPNQRWSMDFVSDCLFNGRKIRVLTIVDDYSRECLNLEVDTSINGVRITNVLNRIGFIKGLPECITIDNGPEFTGKVLDAWAYARGVKLNFIRPGKPVDNAYIESFNGKFREECLNDNWFMSLQNARDIIESWRIDYNSKRPHSSLNGLTPEEFIRQEEEKVHLKVAS
jgi:putative transposase